jgi:intracellular multiplication protein IcmK
MFDRWIIAGVGMAMAALSMIPFGASAARNPYLAVAPQPSSVMTPPVTETDSGASKSAPATGAHRPSGGDVSAGSEGDTNNLFNQALNGVFPLTPAQIKAYQRRLGKTREAIHPGPPPVMRSRTRKIDLSPGAAIPSINVTPNYVSTMVFLDASGAPWPISSVTVGNPTFFTVAAPDVKPRNLITISAMGSHLATNLAITLKGHTTPVIVSLSTNSARSAALTALRANSDGPLAKSPVFQTMEPAGANKTLLAFLDDVPPNGATRMTTKVSGIEAWRFKHHLYLRTRMMPIWPAFVSVARGDQGVHVYSMPDVSSVMLTRDGERVTADFTAADDHNGDHS